MQTPFFIITPICIKWHLKKVDISLSSLWSPNVMIDVP